MLHNMEIRERIHHISKTMIPHEHRLFKRETNLHQIVLGHDSERPPSSLGRGALLRGWAHWGHSSILKPMRSPSFEQLPRDGYSNIGGLSEGLRRLRGGWKRYRRGESECVVAFERPLSLAGKAFPSSLEATTRTQSTIRPSITRFKPRFSRCRY